MTTTGVGKLKVVTPPSLSVMFTYSIILFDALVSPSGRLVVNFPFEDEPKPKRDDGSLG
jgi:hypothetical protein